MKTVFTAILVLQVFIGSTACFAAEPPSEYQLKAVFLYNFLLFTQWPEAGKDRLGDGSSVEKNGTITIGIVGKDPFGRFFDEVEGKTIKLASEKKKLVIKRFGVFRKEMDLKQCQILFICSSEKRNYKKILASVKGIPVLTVADRSGFLEAGGMANLVKKKSKIRWEINQTPIKQAKLRLSSQLLRSAIRIVQIPKLSAEENGKEAVSEKSTSDTSSDYNGGTSE